MSQEVRGTGLVHGMKPNVPATRAATSLRVSSLREHHNNRTSVANKKHGSQKYRRPKSSQFSLYMVTMLRSKAVRLCCTREECKM